MISQKPERMEQIHAAFVQAISHTLRRRKQQVAAPVYLAMKLTTCRTEVKFHYMSKCQCEVSRNSSPCDKRLELSFVKTGGNVPMEFIRLIYLFI